MNHTLLGWIVSGNVQLPLQTRKVKVICSLITNSDLSAQLEKIWKVEHPLSHLLKNDPGKLHVKESTRRDESGRFIVSIPFQENKLAPLGSSKDMAYKRLIFIEKKFEKYLLLKEQYLQFMNEFEELEHMSAISSTTCNNNKPHFNLPHHAVRKEDSTNYKSESCF